MALMAVAENIVRTVLSKRYPSLRYSDKRVRALSEPAPLPPSLNLGIGEKLAHIDVPGKPHQEAPQVEEHKQHGNAHLHVKLSESL